jgi:hypothetical protein
LFERRAKGEGGLEIQKVPIEGWCQGAVMKVGKGRFAVFGEAAMFSTKQVPGAIWRFDLPLGGG